MFEKEDCGPTLITLIGQDRNGSAIAYKYIRTVKDGVETIESAEGHPVFLKRRVLSTRKIKDE